MEGNKTIYLARIELLDCDKSKAYMDILTIRYAYVKRIGKWTLRIGDEELYKGRLNGIPDACFHVDGLEMSREEGNKLISILLGDGWHVVMNGNSDDWNNIATLYAKRAKWSEKLMNYMISTLRE